MNEETAPSRMRCVALTSAWRQRCDRCNGQQPAPSGRNPPRPG